MGLYCCSSPATKVLHVYTNMIAQWFSSWAYGLVVSRLSFYSNDPSLNPAKVYSYFSIKCLKRQKEAEDCSIQKYFKTIKGPKTFLASIPRQ